MKFIHQMDENNITKEKLQSIVDEQEFSYVNFLEYLMSNKQSFMAQKDIYQSEMLTLQKMIKINKRAGNKYAVIRDEVQLKSFRLLRNQNSMIKNVLSALDNADAKHFRKELNSIIIKNKNENKKLMDVDYKEYLLVATESIPSSVKTNIREFYDLVEINKDMINHLYSFEKRMYRLNKYSKYHLIGTVVYINNTALVKNINQVLEPYGLNIIKILFIISFSLILYFIRTVLYVWVQSYLLKIGTLEKYTKDIIEKSKKPISIILVLVNIDFVIYIYNDFMNKQDLSRFFNVLYIFLLFWMIYRIVNIIANIKIDEISQSNTKVKNEMINVGRKIINFLIIVVGLLFALYFAGVDLTTVLSGLGIGGLAVALAAKDSLSNFFGTISILMSDVYSQGDWIVVDGKEGVVIEIGLRVTTLRTFDNALIAIPNATLANKDVKNWNKRTLGRRIKMSLGIKYDSKPQDIKNAVNDIRMMLDKHPKIATKNTEYTYHPTRGVKLVSKDDLQGVKKTLLVYLDEFSDSSINILVYCFTKSVDWNEWLKTKEDVMHKIMEILDKNSLEFAFPSLSIYNENEMKKNQNL